MEQSLPFQKPHSIHLRMIVGICLAITSVVILLLVEAHFRRQSPTGYLQEWTSETLWQTVSIEDLRDQPLQSLWYLHIQPPMLDTIRMVFAQIYKMDDSKAMLFKVDSAIYLVWAFVYGLMIFVIYWWLSKMTNILFASAAALAFSLHPAMLAYSVQLDSTLLSSFLILFFYFILWRIKNGYSVSGLGLAVSFLLLFFTRSIFQWQWVILLAFSLVLMKFPWKKLIVFLSITGIVIGLFTAKQLILFDLSSTSSFSGFNFCRSINCIGSTDIYHIGPSIQNLSSKYGDVKVLTRLTKIEGNINFNNEVFLAANQKLLHQFHSQLYLLLHTPLKLIQIYLENLKIYLLPSSSYMSDLLINHYHLRNFYDPIFSYPILLILLVLAFLGWIFQARKNDFFRIIGFCLPVLFIVFVCIVAERGENMRFKFFVEPIIYIFIASQFFALGKRLFVFIEKRYKKDSRLTPSSGT